jgi:hypothetical protein
MFELFEAFYSIFQATTFQHLESEAFDIYAASHCQ